MSAGRLPDVCRRFKGVPGASKQAMSDMKAGLSDIQGCLSRGRGHQVSHRRAGLSQHKQIVLPAYCCESQQVTTMDFSQDCAGNSRLRRGAGCCTISREATVVSSRLLIPKTTKMPCRGLSNRWWAAPGCDSACWMETVNHAIGDRSIASLTRQQRKVAGETPCCCPNLLIVRGDRE